MSKELNFEDWYDLHARDIYIELAENGADREMDFDPELEFEIRYQKYLENKEDEYCHYSDLPSPMAYEEINEPLNQNKDENNN